MHLQGAVSFLNAKGKKSAWKAWSDDTAIKAFETISKSSSLPSADNIKSVKKFTVNMCGVKYEIEGVNEARKYLLATENRPLSLIPPSSAALTQHILRAAYQAR